MITTSNMLETGYRWINEWKKEGIHGTLVSMPTIKPFDHEFVKTLIKKKSLIITLEEQSIIGGLGSAVSEVIAENGEGVKFKRIGINDTFSHFVGGHEFQRKKHNLINKPNIDF